MARVLLLDDDEAFRRVLRVMLERLGHVTVEARDVQQAIGVLPSVRFDLVLTDLLMPEKDGYEMIRFVRKHAPTVGVIAMSGGGKIGPAVYLDMAAQLGVDVTLVKPFSKTDLENAISEVMRGRPH